VNRRGLESPQGGIALLLALVVLLLVTILGLVGLESAVLELRMAGAQREYALAYQAAQGALNDGERVLKGLSAADLASFEDNRAGRYLPAAPGAPSRASAGLVVECGADPRYGPGGAGAAAAALSPRIPGGGGRGHLASLPHDGAGLRSRRGARSNRAAHSWPDPALGPALPQAACLRDHQLIAPLPMV